MLKPERLGRYLLVRKIATGGMAEIFLAKLLGAEGFEKEIAIKKILPQWSSDKNFVSMLIDEAKIAVQLNHPNIIQVYELAREADTYSIAMEYLHGLDLRRVMQKANAKRVRVPLDVGLMVVIEILEGLAYAHSKRDPQGRPLEIIHRDVSPQNILVSFDGAVKLTDFGIAKAASRSHETVAGVLKGKFAYMSPEQANQEALDARSDIFSTAVVLYELMTGERLFYHGSDIDTLDRVRRGQAAFSVEAEKILPVRLKEILFKALAREKDQRYPTAHAFREDILKFAQRSRRSLRRDKVAQFMSSLFETERQYEIESTRLLTEAVTLLSHETRTGLQNEEILVKGTDPGTMMIPAGRDAPSFDQKQGLKIPPEFLAGGAVLLGAIIWILVIFSREPVKIHAAPAPSNFQADLQEVSPPALVSETQTMTGSVDLADLRVGLPTTAAVRLPSEPASPVKKELKEKGFLSVQAIPWGYVAVDGAGRRETPVRRLPLKAGRHKIEVLYEPEGVSVSSSVLVESDREVLCLANFKGGREMQCGN